MKDELKISVAVCTYRRFELLGDCLELIRKQTLPSAQYEIIVVDNSLQPEESKAFKNSLKDFDNLNYIITEKCGIAYARNVALQHCKAPILLFTDDDVRVPATWVEDFVKVFDQFPAAGVIGGRVDPIWPKEPPVWLGGHLLDALALLDWPVTGPALVTERMWLVTANAGYRVKALKKSGGFCEHLGRKGKVPFWHAEFGANLAVKSLGYDMLYVPHIKVGHMIEPQRMQKEWFYRQQIYGGASKVAVTWQKEEEIDFPALALALEERYKSILLEIPDIPDDAKAVFKIVEGIEAEGQRVCLEYLGIDPSLVPPPRNTSWPVIYVITPCMNAAETIDQTIASVLTQAGPFSIRYHLQDGGSVDGTLDKLEQWKKRLEDDTIPALCNNIVFTYASGSDEGMYDALIRGFASMAIPARAFMAWINSDDIFLPFAFDHIVFINKRYPQEIEWVGGTVSLFDDNHKLWLIGGKSRPTEIIRHGLCDGQHWDFIQQEGIFFRKELWDKALADNVFGGYKLAGDWNLWRTFSAYAKFYQYPWPLGTFRKRDGQLSQVQWSKYKAEIDATISPEKRREAFLELTARGDIEASILHLDWHSRSLVKKVKKVAEDIIYFRQRVVGADAELQQQCHVNPQVQQPQTPMKVQQRDQDKTRPKQMSHQSHTIPEPARIVSHGLEQTSESTCAVELTPEEAGLPQAVEPGRLQDILPEAMPAEALKAERDALALELNALAVELDEIKSKRNELLNSLSWRVTAPLRYVAKFFMKG